MNTISFQCLFKWQLSAEVNKQRQKMDLGAYLNVFLLPFITSSYLFCLEFNWNDFIWIALFLGRPLLCRCVSYFLWMYQRLMCNYKNKNQIDLYYYVWCVFVAHLDLHIEKQWNQNNDLFAWRIKLTFMLMQSYEHCKNNSYFLNERGAIFGIDNY